MVNTWLIFFDIIALEKIFTRPNLINIFHYFGPRLNTHFFSVKQPFEHQVCLRIDIACFSLMTLNSSVDGTINLSDGHLCLDPCLDTPMNLCL